MADKTIKNDKRPLQQLDKVNIAYLEIGQTSVPIVRFDVNLKMTEQINKTCQSVYYHLHNIRPIRKSLYDACVHQIACTRRDHDTH